MYRTRVSLIIVRNVHRCETCDRIADAEKQEYASVGVVPLVAHNFESHRGDDTVSRFKVEEFKSSFRGRLVQAPPLSFSDVSEVGILIADKQEGDFRLQIRTLTAL